MNKILLSLIIISAVGAGVAGVTTAYFSDTETSIGNTFTAGTIDIDIDGENPWTSTYEIDDLKPGEVDYVTFNIKNVGENPVNISKKIYDMDGTGGASGYCGVSSEPEFVEEGGAFYSTGSCNKTGWTQIDNIQTQIIYDLSVEVSKDSSKLWWQTIYSVSDNKSLTNVYGTSGDIYVELGMLPVGGTMIVKQSYHFDINAGNEYQGDELVFSMEIKGEQMAQDNEGNATVTLENKGGAPDWAIMLEDGIQGTLTYKTKASTFDYSLAAKVNTTGNYALIYVGTTGDYPCSGSKIIETGSFTSGTEVTISGTTDLGMDIVDGKFWLIPLSSYSGGVMVSWPQSDILFETGLVNYDDTDI